MQGLTGWDTARVMKSIGVQVDPTPVPVFTRPARAKDCNNLLERKWEIEFEKQEIELEKRLKELAQGEY